MNLLREIKYYWLYDRLVRNLMIVSCFTIVCIISGLILRNSSHIGVVNNLNRLLWIGVLITCVSCLLIVMNMVIDIIDSGNYFCSHLMKLLIIVFEFLSCLVIALCCLAIFLSMCISISASYAPVKTHYISHFYDNTLAIDTGIPRAYRGKIVEQLESDNVINKESADTTKCFDTIDVRFKRKRLKLFSDFPAYLTSVDEFEPEFTYHQNTGVLEGDYDCNIKVFNGITYLEVGNTKFLVKENPFNMIPTGRHHIKIYYDKSRILDLEVYEKYKVVEIT